MRRRQDCQRRSNRRELEYEEQRVLLPVDDLEQRGDVRMRDGGGCARVPQEPGPHKRIRFHSLGGVLDEHGSTDHGIAGSERRAQSIGTDPLEEVAVPQLLWHTAYYDLRGIDGRSSTRLGRLRGG